MVVCKLIAKFTIDTLLLPCTRHSRTFSDHLVKGRVFVQFDNVRGKLDSQYLESFLTAEGTFPARIP
jgi:hypothetical protein